MFLTRLGSLNALEKRGKNCFWARWIGSPLPSADSLGRIASLLDHEDIRSVNQDLYQRLKRNKSLAPPAHGLMVLCIDGHESHWSYRRSCSGCLQRKIKTSKGERLQYYHRQVTAILMGGGLNFIVDSEAQIPGEDEVATALRLLKRIFDSYPRAIDVINADALYTDPRLFQFARLRGIDVITVLKSEQRDLIKDARGLCEVQKPKLIKSRHRQCLCWDMEGFSSWTQVNQTVRVVRSEETWNVRRQLDGMLEEQKSEWLWVTTLSQNQADTSMILQLGHTRWTIENEGFNELTNRWHADHVYRHEENAILSFALLCFIAFNLFHAFYFRNLKPQVRVNMTMLHAARKIRASLDADAKIQRPP